MQHSIKKIKVRGGKDANRALVKKLAMNFLICSKIVTTEKKARVLKSFMERIINKAKVKNEANKNVLLQYFPKNSVVDEIFAQVSTTFAGRDSGFVRVIKLNQRANDGAMMTQVEWVEPVTFNFEKKKVEKVAKTAKKSKKVNTDKS